MIKKRPIGWQIVNVEHDNPPNGMHTYQIYSYEFVINWMAELEPKHKPYWRLLPIFNGDIEEPVLVK